MNTSGRSKGNRQGQQAGSTTFRLAPVAGAIGLMIAAGSAYAAQPFSAGWYAAKGALQETARTTGMVNGKPVSTLTNPAAQQQQANAQLQQSIANLGLAARGIALQQASQALQHANLLKNAPSVPDGLGTGGLDTGSLAASWINAIAPTQTTDANGKIIVGINQTADKAIANWQSFNVGKNTIVQFNQASSDWAILNRITDPLGLPSQIQGQIRAPGTVLIVNKNGIIFSGTSQINTRNLVAAAADITDSQFTASGIYSTQTAGAYDPSFANAIGDLKVEQGAQISTSAPSSVTQGGGYVLLMGKNVSNAGDIETPKGQVAMAAGDNFVIRKGFGTDSNTFSTTRGNEIAPNAGSTGQVINTGLLVAREGDITLAGHDVQQNGAAVATTTVNARGTIHLLNAADDSTGTVTLGSTGTTAILIDDDGKTTALDSQRDALDKLNGNPLATTQFNNLSTLPDRRDESRIEIVTGGNAVFDGGSTTLATGGQIAVSATKRTFVATGATLDVAGAVGVQLAMDSNNLLINVQGNELRDAPINRDSGKLANSNIWVDTGGLLYAPAIAGVDSSDRWYTAGGLLEVSGYLNNQGHRIGEWASVGGTVALSGNEVITQAGSQINISGGSINVATGYLKQTWLKGADGQLYNANNAPADLLYSGVYKGFEVDHARWGDSATEFYYNPLIAPQQVLQNGYTVGRDAGQLIVSTPTGVLEGDLVASVYNGPKQIGSRPEGVTDGYKLAHDTAALSGRLVVGQYTGMGLTGAVDSDITIGTVDNITQTMAASDELASDRVNTVWLDGGYLSAQKLGGVNLYSTGRIAIDTPLTLTTGGQITLAAATIDINAAVTAHGGRVDMGNVMSAILAPGQLPTWWSLEDADGKSQVTIGSGGSLDLTGQWINGLADPDAVTGSLYLNGGALNVSATGGITLAAGAVVNVSSGGAILANGKTRGGKGGDVSLVTNDLSHVPQEFYASDRDAPLLVDGKIIADGFSGGGTLTLNGPQKIVIGNGSAAADEVRLDTSLFSSGFSAYDITAADGIRIAGGTQLNPSVPVYRFGTNGADSGSQVAVDLWQPPVSLADQPTRSMTRRVGADLTLVTTRGDFTLEKNASITVDPGHAINIYAYGQTTIDGDMTARGGSMLIAGAAERLGQLRVLGGTGEFSLNRSIWIGGDATLDASGFADTAVDTFGRYFGSVSKGGLIQLGGAGSDASDAFVIIRPGAVVDVSGTAARIDVQNGSQTVPTRVASDGGQITLNSNSGIYIEGTLRAAAGGSQASGGTLGMNLVSRSYSPLPASPNAPDGIGSIPDQLKRLHNITISQHQEADGLDSLTAGQADASLLFGTARISADQIQQGGFGAIDLHATDFFVFKGDVNLALSRSLTLGGGILAVASETPDIHVALSAPYLHLDGSGNHDLQQLSYNPRIVNYSMSDQITNASSFSVSGDLVDLTGNLRFGAQGQQGSAVQFMDPVTGQITLSVNPLVDLAGFSQVSFNSSGDIRIGNGSIKTAGDMTLTAAQIYPMSGQSSALYAGLINNHALLLEQFDNHIAHTITVRRNGDSLPDEPASVFGSLAFFASVIDQGGVVRAPLGSIGFELLPVFTLAGASQFGPAVTRVILRTGSVTSASANGLVMPFGGTSDGITYQGADGTLVDLVAQEIANAATNARVVTGVVVAANSFVGEAGSLLDLSGGGTLTGAGFISGRGGSVDTLTTPLINANPANAFSAKDNKVYAILPGYASAYAPSIASNGAGDPTIGQHITIAAGVPGLPAGTYTLLPSSYALLPGAFRLELGATTAATTQTVALANGSYRAYGTLGIANTDITQALPTQIILSDGKAVRSYSQYNETSYADFALSKAALFGNVRPRLPEDGKILRLTVGDATAGPSLSFAGTANFAPAGDGVAGVLSIDGNSVFDVTAPGATPTPGHSSVSSDDINAFHATSLFIGGGLALDNPQGHGPRVTFLGSGEINIQDGAELRAGQVFLTGTSINVDSGAVIDTRGLPANGIDSRFGYVFANTRDDFDGISAVLAVANGVFNFLPIAGPGTITIGSGATLLTDGSIVLGAPGALNVGDVNFGARYLTVTLNQINIGDAAAIATAQAEGVLPAGWNLNQTVLDKLMRPSPSAGVAPLEQLTLTAGGAINLIGNTAIDARSQSSNEVELVLNTPAIYGLGAAGDNAVISADHLLWNGIRITTGTDSAGNSTYGNQAPAAITPGGPGTGAGNLNLKAREITFGYSTNGRPTDGVTLDRVAIGFGNVNLIASERVSGNSDGTLSVAQSQDSTGARIGGNLNITTPLITAQQGATLDYKAGGAIRLGAGAAPADTSTVTDYGGTVSFSGDSIVVDTAVALPSGKLTLSATNDVTLGANAHLDLSGRALTFFDQTRYSWGGDLIVSSTQGNLTQDAGSLIDVSAHNNVAGSVTASAIGAAHGQVTFNGGLLGTADDGFQAGRFNLAAQQFGDFAALNQQLNTAGFVGGRTFDLKQGNLVIGSEVRAHAVTISVDAGSLTVNGTIDASGAAPGSIRLAAGGDLTLAATAVLDAHATVLQTDGYGAPVDAANTAHVDLTSSAGTVTLTPGATIDLRAADALARGKLEINAPRLGSTGTSNTQDPAGAAAPVNALGDNVAISAAGPLDIRGAASIALNGFATYTNAPVDPSDPNGQIINQAWLDKVHQDSTAFITAADNNGGLQTRIAGLVAYGPVFHLRPGVEIASATPDGNLSTQGDLDLSGYRYGPNADPLIRGSGEVGVIRFRAGGDLKINGSINDGFAPPPVSPDALNLLASGALDSDYTVTTAGAVLSAGAVLPAFSTINLPLSYPDNFLLELTPLFDPLPVDIVLNDTFTPQFSFRTLTGTIYRPDGSVMYADGDTIQTGAANAWPAGTRIAAGSYFDGAVATPSNPFVLKAFTLPPNTMPDMFGDYKFTTTISIPVGTILPAGMNAVSLTSPGDRTVWPTSAMLAPGSQSWSLQLVAGADLAAADGRALHTPDALAGKGNVILNDPFNIGLVGSINPSPGVSVVRTGTGNLDILAGGSYQQLSPFGVYTAGTAIAETGTLGNAPYNVDRGLFDDGTVLGAVNDAYKPTLNAQRMYYTTGGGDFMLTAQGDISGFLKPGDSTLIGNWLWRQGGNGQATAWGINFGSYVAAAALDFNCFCTTGTIGLAAFSGMGTLGGGNVTLRAGGDIGAAAEGIVVAVGGSGRVTADGRLLQTGGGALSVTAGHNIGTGGNQFVNLRGNIDIATGDFGMLTSSVFGFNGSVDPRPVGPFAVSDVVLQNGGSFAPGDSTISLRARGDLVVGNINDPGRVGLGQQTAATDPAVQQASWFSLWTPKTALNLMAAGGDLAPLSSTQGNDSLSTEILPPILQAVAANGSVWLTPSPDAPANMQMPSSYGVLDVLARGSVIEPQSTGNPPLGTLASPTASITTPFAPAWVTRAFDGFAGWVIGADNASNVWSDPSHLPDKLSDPAYSYDDGSVFAGAPHSGIGGTLFAFGQNTVADDSALKNALTSHIYAVGGDINGLTYGQVFTKAMFDGSFPVSYQAAKLVNVVAGGDIVGTTGLIVHDDPTDISVIAAGGSVIDAGVKFRGSLKIAGPGTLEITAGHNIYQGSDASVESIGPLVSGDDRPGASVVMQAGVGAGVPGQGQVDWTGFAMRYLDPANLAGPGPLADQPGKVARTYDSELMNWLQGRFAYAGTSADALAYFLALPAAQQRVFLRSVYYAELTAGGREYNDPASPRFASYLRGRDAISALFPDQQAYQGNITMFSAAQNNDIVSGSVHTDFGGDIQFLAPGGGVTVGTSGLVPGADAGLITQGSGNIQIYAKDSLLLGLSRIMTTFGGNILAWSAEGDINAGRGSKTTVVFTPPKLTYDDIGDITLSPVVPSTGAGIATLAPIPEVPAGDVDLIAPLGTIDAGEAGIRVSGNVNLAALQVVNAANIQVQGKSTGLPLAVTVNVNALTNAGAAATQASMAAQDVVRQQQTAARQTLPSIFTVRVLGFGNDPAGDPDKAIPTSSSAGMQSSRDVRYDPSNPVQFVGVDKDFDARQLARLSNEQRRLLQQER